MSNPTRRAALASIGAAALASCSGSQRGGSTSGEPVWLFALELVVSTARAGEPIACGIIAGLLPPAALACTLVGSSLDVLADALAAYRAAHGASDAVCAVHAAANAALAARLDVTTLLTQAGLPAAPVVAAIAGALSLAIDALLPPCRPADAAVATSHAMMRMRTTFAPGAASSGGTQ